MEWLAGPTLSQLATQGEEARATRLLGEIAHAVSSTNFRFSVIYGRVVPELKSDLKNRLTDTKSNPQHSELQRSLALLDHLTRTTPEERVIHGDLWLGNVIPTANGPHLIDPKGLRADPAFEVVRALVVPYDNYALPKFTTFIDSRASALGAAANMPSLRIIQCAAIKLAQKAIHSGQQTPKNSHLLPYLTSLLDMSEQTTA